MTIQELAYDQKIEIEIIWGGKTLVVKSTVVGKQGAKILLQPYVFHGTEIRVHENARDFTFNIYAIEKQSHHRVGWKDVEMKSIDYQGVHYYICSVKTYLMHSNDSERRDQIRTVINIPGSTCEVGSTQYVPVRIHDISSTGIAFLASSNQEYNSINVYVDFTDNMNGRDFNLHMRAQIVRTEKRDGKTLYGCRFLETPADLLMYIFLKRSFEKEMRL